MTASDAGQQRRPLEACRSWLFTGFPQAAGGDIAICGADAIILELEDFTVPAARGDAWAAAPELFARWRDVGALVAVRVNPLDGDGRDDLEGCMAGRPDVVMLPKVAGPDDIAALADAIGAHETSLGIEPGSTKIVPNIESASALFQTRDIAAASARLVGCLLASEDLTADLGAPRTRDGHELAFARQYFHAACVAAGVLSIDYPYTFADEDGLERSCADALALGYRAKSLVAPEHAERVNDAFTPGESELAAAQRIVGAFTQAREKGQDRARLDGHILEVPTFRNAQALIARADLLAAYAR
ncbi:HpcH/HpaI aldolase/citrate lyase family protein [Tepidamorphus sp. 3E244]|uniref:HpcH/HpaI aldolase/citrate lyase family protein n=1 Tax=Tepidamorphus sp. 3E244 TaxID=3385498 RepID=UPI0038FC409C